MGGQYVGKCGTGEGVRAVAGQSGGSSGVRSRGSLGLSLRTCALGQEGPHREVWLRGGQRTGSSQLLSMPFTILVLYF